MRARSVLGIVVVSLVAGSAAFSQQTTKPAGAKAAGKTKKKKELRLEDLFPEKGLFGPRARSTSFSHDGRYGAYLYRPYKERRHGSDLWIVDCQTGKARRVTKVSVMAEFQADTRKVKEDRIKKAGKSGKKKKGPKKGSKLTKLVKRLAKKLADKDIEDKENGDWVTDKDADQDKDPRYAAISSYTWSPHANELLFSSGGDIYRYFVEKDDSVRLTKTKDSERSVRYLPDGSGYTYLRGGALIKVAYDSHLAEQLDPKLPAGETMSSYSISPDGKRLVFLTTKKGKAPKPQRTVKIARYRDRFMNVREVPRTVSDDPQVPTERSVYLYEPKDPMIENGKLWNVFSYDVTGPRDILRTPEWAPDSSRVVFSVFEQESDHVQIMEADFPPREEKKDEEKTDEENKDEEGEDKEGSGDDDKDDDAKKKDEDKKDDKDEAKERKARVVHRFLHNGGPNTPRMMQPQYLSDSRRIVFLSEQTGFRQLHVLDPLYETVDQLTRGRYEVYPIDVTKDHKWMFLTATKEHPSRRDVYKLEIETGEMTRLSKDDGFYGNVAVSPDGNNVLADFAKYGRLRELVYIDETGDEQDRLTDSHPQKAKDLTKPRPEFFTYKNRHGHEIHGMMFKPDDWSPRDKRPLLIYVYGGPLGDRKMVNDGSYSADAYFFAYYLAKKHGYVTCTIDPRGVSGYGALFEKANFEQVGKPQVEDLVDGAKWFIKNHGVDKKKVAIHGWSFGGFQTQMCMYTEPDVFACGMAGAGPTEWENYNSWYSTGTIGKSREGKTDLKKYSLLPLAKNLEGKLLLIHGMEDPNVLYQDTVRVYRELLKAGKETLVELFLDPTGGHGLGGDVKRLGRYRKYEEFLLRNLGKGEPSRSGRGAGREQWVKENYDKKEHLIPMRDGVKLFTAVYSPKDTSRKYPMMMIRTPYSVRPYGEDRYRGSLGPSRLFMDEGYIFVYQDVRGRTMSEGDFVNMTPHIGDKKDDNDVDESSDTHDTIEWLMENVKNHNGRVGMWGISYPGFYAAASMIDAHPALKAVSPQAPIADWWYDDFHHHGAFFLPHGFNFISSFGRPRPEPTAERGPRFRHGTPDGYDFFLNLGPLKNANQRHFKGENPMWNNMVAHPNYDEFWQRRNILPHLHESAPAVMTVGGWYDAEDLYGALQIYRSVEAKNPDAFNILIMGPWAHGGWARGDGDRLGHVRFGGKQSLFYRENIEFPFFQHHLKDAGDPDLPEAYVFETGANKWRTFDDWPPATAEPEDWYFNEGGLISYDEPTEDNAFDQYVSDPNKPVPFTEDVSIGMTRAYMTDDQRFAGRRPDVLFYQTDVLEADVTLAGPILADLWVSTSGTASDWVVKLIDVLPDDTPDPTGMGRRSRMRMGGYQMMVRSEVIRGRFRNSHEKPEPFEPNTPTNVELPLQDVLHTFQKGHRIMVQIQSTWFPLVDRNPQKYVDNIFEADEDDFIVATQRVYRSKDHPTRLRVGVIHLGEGSLVASSR